ncbi:MAG TPA: alpha/beta fold hydrolase [Chthoniobacteraceae bacterium]|nr:alpha/beta fold hydrolase [Chthoniobacteraceae bacterium]
MTIALIALAAAAILLFVVMRIASSGQSAIPVEPAAPGQRVVILVHGIWDAGVKMDRMAMYFRKRGYAAFTPTLVPNWGQLGLDELAAQLAAFAEKHVPPGEKFDLIGFSMGGLICRYYLQRLGGLQRVAHFVTLGAPHHGSMLAWFVNNPGCLQMRPGSVFIKDLNSDIAALRQAHFASIWTPFDLIIIPSSSSRTEVSRNFILWLPIHPLLVWSPKSLRLVAELLKA